MTYSRVPLGTVMEQIRDLLKSAMPARLTALGLPVPATADFRLVALREGEDDLPQVIVEATASRRPIGAGGAFLPLYDVRIICAFRPMGREEAFRDGADMATVADAVMFDNAGYDNPPGTVWWSSILVNSARSMPAGQEGQWEGGVCTMTLEGDPQSYG